MRPAAAALLLAWLVVRLARALPRPAKPELAIALRNVAASDGLTRSVSV